MSGFFLYLNKQKMSHEEIINKNPGLFDTCKFLGIQVSGYKRNIHRFKQRRSQFKIMWYQIACMYHELNYTFQDTLESKIKAGDKLYKYQSLLDNEYDYKLSWWKKVSLTLMMIVDLARKKCCYKTIQGKKILIYKDIRHLRL